MAEAHPADRPQDVAACLFIAFSVGASSLVRSPDVALESFAPMASRLATAPGFVGLRAHVPSDADDPYLKDTDAPGLVLQLYFDGVDALRDQGREGSALARESASVWPSEIERSARMPAASHDAGNAARPLAPAATWQAMQVERIELAASEPLPEVHCTYLVAYDGTSPDEAAWHAHYAEHHVPLMKRLPGLRQLELYRPLGIELAMPALRSFERSGAMQRNKVVFDSPQALTAALNSPIRHEMRKDYRQSPPFEGRSTHHPMATRSCP